MSLSASTSTEDPDPKISDRWTPLLPPPAPRVICYNIAPPLNVLKPGEMSPH